MPMFMMLSSDPDSSSPRPERSSRISPLRRRVLIVEDEDGVLKPLEMRFRKAGFHVIAVRDGLQAIEEIRRKNADMIILDLVLPKLSGEEVCKAVREDSDEAIASIPIIMLTGKDTVADRIVGKVLGANAYITKPFDFDTLLDKVLELSSAA